MTKKTLIIMAFICMAFSVHAQNKYAVLITGDYAAKNINIPKGELWNEGKDIDSRGMMEFWNDTYLMWELLQNKGFDRENIFVLFADGNDFSSNNPRYQAPSGITVTDYPATFDNVKSVFEGLKDGIGFPKITTDDFLFVWTFDHGTHDADDNYGILLLNNDVLIDDTLANWINGMNVYRKAFWMQQCHGGGFATALQGENTVFHSACQANELGYRADDYAADGVPFVENEIYQNNPYNHGEFNYHVFSVCNGTTPSGQPIYANDTLAAGDINHDGYISFYEAYDWEFNHESIDKPRGETPCYSDLGGIGMHTSFEYPTLLFDNIADNETCSGIIGISKDLHVSGGQTLNIIGNSIVTLCNNAKIVIDNGGSLVLDGNVSFMGMNDNIMEIHGDFLNNSYDSVNFNNMQVHVTSESIFISQANFNDAELIYKPRNSSSIGRMSTLGNITIQNCHFNNPNKNVAVRIDNTYSYNVHDNIITSSAGNGIYIMNSGNSAVGSGIIRRVINNSIEGCHSTGLLMYASSGDVRLNRVFNNGIGVKLLNNCNISNFNGRCNATTAENTQYIHDNHSYEIYMTSNCAPQTMHYNVIKDNGIIPFIYYDGNVGFAQVANSSRGAVIDVTHNAWGNAFNPSIHLYSTSSSVMYNYLPYWSLGSCYAEETRAQRLVAVADSLCESGDLSSAKVIYQQVVDKYPQTVSAATALKTFLPLEKQTEQNYSALRQYYLTDSIIISDTILNALASSLSNQCDEVMGKYSEAIEWYENIISNPATSYYDSIFATIDLGNLCLELENIGCKDAIDKKIYQYLPESKEVFYKQTDEALSLLPKAGDDEGSRWTDIVTAQPSGYAVDANGDVEISSAEGLAWLISVVNGLNGCEPYDFNGHTVSLVSDVDLGGNEWVPVGDAVASPRLPFKGVFDGNRHVISNLNIYDHSFSKQYLGLFGYVSGAEIHDVALDGGNVYGGSYCGGVAGWGDDGSVIDNCHINMTVGSDFYPGGVVGRNRNSTVRNCCYVDDDFMAWDTYSGGIAGINESDGGNAVVENCYFDSKSEYTLNTRYFGGIVGHNSVIGTEGNAIVRNCYARLVEHIGNEGAIVGQNDGGEVSNCYYNSGYDIPVIGNGDMTSVDCSRFFINENVGAVLQTPVSIGENVIDNLLDALNAWVSVQTSPTLYNEWCESSELLPFFCYLIFADVDESYVSENAVNVYPNPASGSISVSVNSGAEIGSVGLFDVSGRLVKTQQSGFGSIDISGLATGMYVMKVTLNDGKVFEEKIVKK